MAVCHINILAGRESYNQLSTLMMSYIQFVHLQLLHGILALLSRNEGGKIILLYPEENMHK